MLFVKGTKHCQGLVHAPPPVETKMSLWNWMVHCQGLLLPSKPENLNFPFKVGNLYVWMLAMVPK